MIRVGTGVIVREGRILLTQRGSHGDFPFMWECPGGKALENETIVQAICREVGEEVGVCALPESHPHVKYSDVVCDLDSIYTHTFEPGEAAKDSLSITFHVLRSTKHAWRPILADQNVIGFGWFELDEIRIMKLLPGNVKLLDAIDEGEVDLAAWIR